MAEQQEREHPPIDKREDKPPEIDMGKGSFEQQLGGDLKDKPEARDEAQSKP